MGRLSDLHQKLVNQYNAEELRVLCFDLDVSYDTLAGEALPARVAALLRHLDTRNRLPDLIEKVRRDRPNEAWAVPAPRSAENAEDDELSDTIHASKVIQNSGGNVVIGSKNVNVFQVGSINMPRSLVYGLIAAVVIIGIAVIVVSIRNATTSQQGQKQISEKISQLQVTATPGPMKMNGLFNIAVAPFSQVDTNGKLEFSNEGLELSDWVYKQLTKEIKETDALIWSDKIPQSQKGIMLGIITGTTPAERQQSAESLAIRVGAQMVIFGQLSGNESTGEFAPEFYIATSAQKLKGEAEEVLGSHQLGTPIRIPRPMQLNADEALMLNQNLNSRAIFVKGVLLDLLGLHVVAYKEFEKIEQGWSKDEVAGTGKEVLPQFMARELVFVLDQPADLADLGMSRDEALAQAQKLVRKALSNPNYGLAHLQQGNLAMSRAEPVLRTFISEMLSQNTVTFTAEYSPAKAEVVSATQAYSQFLSLSKGSADAASQTKAQISLANALRLQAYTQWLEGQFDAAINTFERANQTLDLAFVAGDMDKPRLRVTAQWVRGDIAVGQAIVVYQLGDDAGYAALLQKAKLALETCVQLKGDLDETLKTIQKQCQQKLDGITGAQ